MIKKKEYILILINILFLVFVTSCVKKEITIVDNGIRKVTVKDNNGYLVNTYFEKYNSKYAGWLKANCKKIIDFELFNDSFNCKFTSSSLNLINNSKNDNNIQIASKDLNNSSLQQENQQQENQQQENQQQEGNNFPNPPSNCDPRFC